MTPSPTPTPDAVLTRFRLIRYGLEGDEVAIPVDKYGRVMVTPPDDGNVRYCPWWADTFSIFDDASDTELVNAMSDFGFVECLTMDSEQHSFTVNLDNIEETLVWNEAKQDFQLNVPMWQNAQANLQYRAFVEGSSTIYAVIDMETGRLAAYTDDQDNDRILRYVPNSGGSGIDEIWSELLSQHSDLATQAGGVKQIEFFVSDEGDNNETQTIANTVDGEIFVVNVNMDGQYRPVSDKLLPLFRLQIFSDEDCTVRPSGQTNKVYAKLNVAVWANKGVNFGHNTALIAPYPEDSEYPNFPFAIWYYADFRSVDMTFEDGIMPPGIYLLNNGFNDDVSEYQFDFL